MQRLAQMSEMARVNNDIGVLHAVELARQKVARRAKGTNVESDFIADAMRRLRESDAERRAARRSQVQQQKQLQ